MANIEGENNFGMQLIRRFQEWKGLRDCMRENMAVIDDLKIRLYNEKNDGLGVPYSLSGPEMKECRGLGGVLVEIREKIKNGGYEMAKIFVPSGSTYEVVLVGGRHSLLKDDNNGDIMGGGDGQWRPRF